MEVRFLSPTLMPVGGAHLAEVAEWQTRRSQKPLPARAWGFDSPSRHQSSEFKSRLCYGAFLIVIMCGWTGLTATLTVTPKRPMLPSRCRAIEWAAPGQQH